MSGLGSFLRKEATEIVRTWRVWVLPGLLVFFGIASPFVARMTPALVASLAEGQSGITIQVPEPTALDAYLQFSKNLTQLVSLAVVIALAGVVSAETRGGTAALVLTKPVSRAAFVLAKALSQAALLSVSTLAGTALCLAATAAIFPGGDARALALGVGLWLAFALVLVAAMVLVSSVADSQAAAAAIGLGVYFALGLAGLWAPLRDWTPVGLLPLSGAALTGAPVDARWPLLTAAVAFVVLVAVAARVFGRREL